MRFSTRHAEVDEQRHQRLFHRVVGLVQKVEHGEGAHAERVAGEDAARHLGRLSGEAAAFKDDADDIRAERAHHRADRQDEKQRVFRHVPDVARYPFESSFVNSRLKRGNMTALML